MATSAERFLETLYEVAPQHHASVPRYWSKLASRVIVGIENSSAAKRTGYSAAMRVGQAYRRRRWNGERRGGARRALPARARDVFSRMLKKIGLHRVRIALSAGAPLPAEVQALWQVWGVNLKNLYGQTEGGVLAAQFDAFPRPGSVGRAYPAVDIRLGADDEIIGKSPGCFAGYWGDADGVRGGAAAGRHPHRRRRHARCCTANCGSSIARRTSSSPPAARMSVPSRIETALKSSPYISEASVIGEGRKYLTVLIELDVGTASEWARANEVVVHELPVACDQSRDLQADRAGGAARQ